MVSGRMNLHVNESARRHRPYSKQSLLKKVLISEHQKMGTPFVVNKEEYVRDLHKGKNDWEYMIKTLNALPKHFIQKYSVAVLTVQAIFQEVNEELQHTDLSLCTPYNSSNSSPKSNDSSGSGGNKVDEEIELYQRLASMYKMSKKWGNAGEAFVKAAELHLRNSNRHDCATAYCDAATCYKKSDSKVAVACLEKAIEKYLEMGRFSLAAKHHQTIAETLEQDAVLEKAIHHYEQAADLFKVEKSNAAATTAMLKVAHHVAQLKDYVKLVNVYEKLAKLSLEDDLLKYSANEYFFRAGISALCVDVPNAQQVLKGYIKSHPLFGYSAEYTFIKTITTHAAEKDVDACRDDMVTYAKNCQLAVDPWYSPLFERIGKTLDKDFVFVVV